jgi:TetR/AcrR family transcriptional repressor of nem operon
MGANTREVILEKALDLFHAKGYTATGVMDITRAAGVPKGSFYHFFDSKEKLALETVSIYTASTQVEILEGPGESPLQRIRDHIEHMIWLAGETGFERGCLLGNFSTEMPSQSAEVSAAVEAALTRWTEMMARTITAAKESGEISADGDPERLAAFIIGGLEGALARAKVSQSRAPLDDFSRTVFEDLLRQTTTVRNIA